MKILIIDNYDSFTYNLYQYIGEILEWEKKSFLIDVIRNDAKTLSQIKKRAYHRIVISPGPGSPADPDYFGVCGQVILTLGKKIPLLGVCLGMQGIAHAFGGHIHKALKPMHGKTSTVQHDGRGIFTGLPKQLEVMRYHSLIVQQEKLPSSLKVTARAGQEIMGLRHRKYPIEGIQFHPESFATEGGKHMLRNFLRTE